MNSKQLYFRLLGYVQPYWKRLVVSILLLALLAATAPIFPALMKPLLDEGFTNRKTLFIQWIPVFLVGLFLLRGMLTFTSSYTSSWVAARVVADLRKEMFSHLISLPVSFFDNNSSGRLSSHIAYDAHNLTNAATTALTVLTRDSLTIIGLMAWLIWLDWKLTTVTLVMFPFIALIIRYFNKRLRHVSSQSQNAMANITHAIEESATNNRIIKIFTAEQYESKRFHSVNEKQRGLTMRSIIAGSAIAPLVQVLVSLSVAIIIAIALNAPDADTTSAGSFMSFLTALLLLLPSIKRLADITLVIQRGLAAAEVVFSLLDEHQERTITRPMKQKKNIYGIQFSDVSFYYPGSQQPILKQFSLKIPAGKTVALIGRSGSGKTTITNLLSGYYCPDKGDIFLDNIKFKDLSLQEIRSSIALVSQHVQLFNDTILHNVAYGIEKPNVSRVQDALKHAHALDFVTKLPDGINSLVGQNGIKLSGGQRQRIAIARAFYKDAPILILDEATSALDTESERNIQEALEDLMNNRTTIVIAHRLSTIEKSDLIVVMEQGAIAEKGTHNELIDQNGLYSHYQKLQFAD